MSLDQDGRAELGKQLDLQKVVGVRVQPASSWTGWIKVKDKETERLRMFYAPTEPSKVSVTISVHPKPDRAFQLSLLALTPENLYQAKRRLVKFPMG